MTKINLQHPRFSTQYKIAGTENFRLGSTKILRNKRKDAIHANWGGNAQNKNKEIRRYICKADKGKSLIQMDEFGADALIVAYLCPTNSNFRKLFLNNIKPHTYCAATIFKDIFKKKGFGAIDEILSLPIDEVKNHPEWKVLSTAIKDSDNEPMRYYFMGKKVIHGYDYFMHGKTMAQAICTETSGAVNLSAQFCDGLLGKWRERMPEIERNFHLDVVGMAGKENGILRNFFGHPREFTGRWEDATFRKMYAFIPASTVAMIIHYAVCEIQEDICLDRIDNEKWGIDLLQNGHDSLLLQCNSNHVTEVIKYVKPHIERDLTNFKEEKFKMKSECQVGKNWSNYKPIYNEEGLKEVFI